MIITDEALANALAEMQKQGFELGKVYSNPYATAFKPQPNLSGSISKQLKNSPWSNLGTVFMYIHNYIKENTIMSGLTIDIAIWQGLPIGTAAGSTPFGYFDSDAQFLSDAPKVADFCARRLGYPMMDVELQSGSFFACFEQATSEFGNIINEYNVVDNFINLQGSSIGAVTNISQTNIAPNLGRVLQIAKEYGSEAGVGGRLAWKTGSLSIYTGQQNYNINTLFRDIVHPSESVEIKRIFHDGPPAIVRYFDPFVGTGMGSQQMLQSFGWGSYSPGVSFLMMPMYSDLLRLQAIEFNDQVRKAAYSFEIHNNVLRIFPVISGVFGAHTGSPVKQIMRISLFIRVPNKISFGALPTQCVSPTNPKTLLIARYVVRQL